MNIKRILYKNLVKFIYEVELRAGYIYKIPWHDKIPASFFFIPRSQQSVNVRRGREQPSPHFNDNRDGVTRVAH
jgi:hypothetical protein